MNTLESLQKQIDFIVEVDKLKNVLRKTSPIGLARLENSAEHSWQVVLSAILFAEHANEPIDLLKVVKMLVIHVGDTFHYQKADDHDLLGSNNYNKLSSDVGQTLNYEFNVRNNLSSSVTISSLETQQSGSNSITGLKHVVGSDLCKTGFQIAAHRSCVLYYTSTTQTLTGTVTESFFATATVKLYIGQSETTEKFGTTVSYNPNAHIEFIQNDNAITSLNLQEGQASSSFTIRNTGGSDAENFSVNIPRTMPVNFAVSSCPATLKSGKDCEVRYGNFNNISVGSTHNIKVSSNNIDNPNNFLPVHVSTLGHVIFE